MARQPRQLSAVPGAAPDREHRHRHRAARARRRQRLRRRQPARRGHPAGAGRRRRRGQRRRQVGDAAPTRSTQQRAASRSRPAPTASRTPTTSTPCASGRGERLRMDLTPLARARSTSTSGSPGTHDRRDGRQQPRAPPGALPQRRRSARTVMTAVAPRAGVYYVNVFARAGESTYTLRLIRGSVDGHRPPPAAVLRLRRRTSWSGARRTARPTSPASREWVAGRRDARWPGRSATRPPGACSSSATSRPPTRGLRRRATPTWRPAW